MGSYPLDMYLLVSRRLLADKELDVYTPYFELDVYTPYFKVSLPDVLCSPVF